MNANNHHSLPSCQQPTSAGMTERTATAVDNGIKQQERFRSVSAGSNGNAAVKRYEAPVPTTLAFPAMLDSKHVNVADADRSEKYGAKDKHESQ